ncbi:MAG: hypothetical protein ACYCRD_04935 [Leptospirillum sp.]
MTRWLRTSLVLVSLLFLWPSIPAHGLRPSGARTELFTGSGYVWVYANGATAPVHPAHKAKIQPPAVTVRGVPGIGRLPVGASASGLPAALLTAIGIVFLALILNERFKIHPIWARGPPQALLA